LAWQGYGLPNFDVTQRQRRAAATRQIVYYFNRLCCWVAAPVPGLCRLAILAAPFLVEAVYSFFAIRVGAWAYRILAPRFCPLASHPVTFPHACHQAGLAVFQILRSAQGLTSEGIREEGYNIIKDAIGQTTGIDVSGVANSTFPKNNGTGGSNQTTSASSSGTSSSNNATGSNATVSGAQVVAQFSRQDLIDNPSALEAVAIQLYRKDYLADNQPGGVNNYISAWNQLPDSKKQEYKTKVLA
jgi:hypothetical protein